MSEFSFQINYDENSYTVMGYKGNSEEVIVPETFLGKPVTILFDKLFLKHPEIRSIKIPDTVTDLGEFVFDGCENLRHIDLPKSLRNIWGYTFARCGIEEIILPDRVRAIPPYAFKECMELKKVICGAGMKKIYSWAFGGCPNLTELIHGPGVEISPEAFDMNTAILKVQ